MFNSVAGRSVVVTGGSRGIGRGIARVFAEAGARVLLVARDESSAKEATKQLSAGGAVVSYTLGDIADPAVCRAVAAVALERHGGIDVLCANAGIYPESSLAEMAVAELDEVLGVNLRGCILSVQACLPALQASGRGRVILTSSITGPITGYPGSSVYGASKAGQLGFMRSAAIELAPMKITVNAVLPGNILTEGLRALGPDYLRAMTAAVPQGRLGSPEDVGYACLYLASDEAAYVTGQALVVDGGQVLPESASGVTPPAGG
ncbi:MAG: 3-oxoacyl-ACP reductase FabG [Candidatus Dormibacteria bacterium]